MIVYLFHLAISPDREIYIQQIDTEVLIESINRIDTLALVSVISPIGRTNRDALALNSID
jgi:hypothetical protein